MSDNNSDSTVYDNTFATARNVSLISSNSYWTDSVNMGMATFIDDRYDVYKFTINTTSNFNLSLSINSGSWSYLNGNGASNLGISSIRTLLYAEGGTLVGDSSSGHIGNSNLATGTYYAVVMAANASDYTYLSYNLSMSAAPLVVAQPDLEATNITFGSNSVTQGDNISFTSLITNIGTGSAPESTAGVYIDGTWAFDINLPVLDSNVWGRSDWSFSTSNLRSGDHVFLIKADKSDAINESNEGNNTREQTFTIVEPPPVNHAPTVNTSIPLQSTIEGEAFSYTIPDDTFSDPDGDTLTYTVNDKPDWLSFDGNNTFSGTTPLDSPDATITITATDPSNESISTTLTISTLTPVPVNQAPTVNAAIPAQMATENERYDFLIPADTFSDPDGDILTYTVNDKPDWLSFDSTTNTFSGTAPLDSPDAAITITATDPSNESISTTLTITTITPTLLNNSYTGTVTIDDTTPKVNQILTAISSLADADGLGEMTYKWFANDVEVDTGVNHIVNSNEIGKSIKVTASYTDGKGFFEEANSDATGSVSEVIKADYNGHSYFLSQSGTWAEAEAEAISKGGHLVTINDQAEQDFLQNSFSENQQLWIGLTDQDSEGDWKWISGENPNYDHWNNSSSEPNNAGGSENYAVMMTGLSGLWNDVPLNFDSIHKISGIIEIVNNIPTEGDDTLTGTTDNDSIAALAGNDSISTLEGNDTIDGGLGIDTMEGGIGNDTYYVDDSADEIIETSALATEIDKVYSNVTYLLPTNVEKLTLTGITAINATGNALNNVLIGNIANNILNGSIGIDWAYYNTATAGVKVNLGLTTAQNTVSAGTDTLVSIENLLGSNYNDTLIGNAANNVLNGGNLNDILRGEAGNDLLNGGNGIDWAYYNTATAGVKINLGLTAAQNTVSAGSDTLVNIENLLGSNYSDTLFGNSANNVLNGGNLNDILRGEAGNDVLNGGTGIDWAYYNTATAGVKINLGLTAAQNTVSAGSDTLVNIENLLGSNYNDTLIGNGVNNVLNGGNANDVIFGNNGSDTLNGGNNNDILNGGLGNDILTGGSGLDIFRFNTAIKANVDKITDFAVADDTLQLENAVFTKLTTIGLLSADNFNTGLNAVDANDYVIYNNSTGALYYDIDGNGAANAIQIALLGSNLSLTNSDFLVI